MPTARICSRKSVAGGIWEIRRQVQKDVLPRKSRLEALLKEVDGQ